MSDVEVVKHLLYTYRTFNIILSHYLEAQIYHYKRMENSSRDAVNFFFLMKGSRGTPTLP